MSLREGRDERSPVLLSYFLVFLVLFLRVVVKLPSFLLEAVYVPRVPLALRREFLHPLVLPAVPHVEDLQEEHEAARGTARDTRGSTDTRKKRYMYTGKTMHMHMIRWNNYKLHERDRTRRTRSGTRTRKRTGKGGKDPREEEEEQGGLSTRPRRTQRNTRNFEGEREEHDELHEERHHGDQLHEEHKEGEAMQASSGSRHGAVRGQIRPHGSTTPRVRTLP